MFRNSLSFVSVKALKISRTECSNMAKFHHQFIYVFSSRSKYS